MFALRRYLEASGDLEFLAREGAEVLVETARLWVDLGFYSTNGNRTFHIHRVTGPDEYTTVVNDNAYTNVMARFNLRYAARTVRFLAEWNPEQFAALCRATGLQLEELDEWDAAADAMFIPFDDRLGIHPQDSSFLELEPWDWEGVPKDKYPLLLNFHPLVIYRHQVLKQADVVLAMFLRREHFSIEQMRRNFDYYDPITTGDSSLSACVQAIVAAEVGYDDLALEYFEQSLYLDLCDTHGNTADGVHVASLGGVWAGVVHGFAGMVEWGDYLEFSPRLPAKWDGLTFKIHRHGSVLRVDLERDGCTLEVVEGAGVPIIDGDDRVMVEPASHGTSPRRPEPRPSALSDTCDGRTCNQLRRRSNPMGLPQRAAARARNDRPHHDRTWTGQRRRRHNAAGNARRHRAPHEEPAASARGRAARVVRAGARTSGVFERRRARRRVARCVPRRALRTDRVVSGGSGLPRPAGHQPSPRLLSNGNTYPDRCGLDGVFDAVVLGPSHGFEKPDPRAFDTIATRLGAEPAQMIHVGDDWDDVEGANAAGMVSVYLNRDAADPPFRQHAAYEIANLHALELVLHDIS